ncbi:hypothetical protein RISW2_07335 [Roseivivax isoporae LMG 25204]|uniref:Uncharacterized protein n=1 Tax=Roseivivax isoporae LMG 25204 TaxID=1449351 RepID=X7FCT1_9RHOB|nr:hypothetical protein RISW2_07335 [Roseivivax isoporae LMG 25204]
MSAIDWLGREGAQPSIAPRAAPPPSDPRSTQPFRPDEPPVADRVVVPEIEVRPLGAPDVSAVGLLPTRVTGLPVSLWQGSTPDRLSALIAEAEPAVPALAALMNTLMLAEADPPDAAGGSDAGFLAVRVMRLIEDGALDAAAALLDRAGPDRRALFGLWFDVALLTGREAEPCAALEANPRLTEAVAPRVFCAARSSDWPRAQLAFETGRALGELRGRDADLLERFLSPEMAEELPALPPPRDPSPLQFRLHEAVGEPLPARSLKRRFAVAELSGDHGWKAQIEAAERLARTGALAENRLLGIYTERSPAASGGVWERVEAVQDLEAALQSGDADRIGGTLTRAWARMREARLLVPFARLFGGQLAGLRLDGPAADLALRTRFLSEDYEEAADSAVRTGGAEARFLAALARGRAPVTDADLPQADALAAAFADPRPATPLTVLAGEARLGEAILETMALFRSGAAGNGGALTEAIATLRALGLEDTARRAALQLAILGSEDARP